MKFLLCAPLSYYGNPNIREPVYYYFHDTLVAMGHQVDCENTYPFAHSEEGRADFHQRVLDRIRGGGYAAVFVATVGQEFSSAFLDEARKDTVTIAWNSDDDWRWDAYSSRYAPHYSLMYTTYKDVYEANRAGFPNLRLSQWACLGTYDGLNTTKDIGFSFCGQVYADRLKDIYRLRRAAGLKPFGKGTLVITGQYVPDKLLRGAGRRLQRATGIRLLPEDALTFLDINAIWCRSGISLNLMRSSLGNKLQIKSRTFDMGVSGTMMLCEHSPNLELYYEPGREFVAYESLEDCAEKAKYYLAHEDERSRIARAYYDRTRREHLWTHRLAAILRDAGFG
jgi:spore maturation protein CgeB